MVVKQSASFWMIMAAFQIAFGLAVFFGTRYFYLHASVNGESTRQPGSELGSVFPEETPAVTPAMLDALVRQQPASESPASIAQGANRHFEQGRYAEAANLYERLIEFDPRNVDAYNNLGLTLHYLGRSAEALQWLEAGIDLDSAHQRSWLTAGFVHMELGNVDSAVTALQKAVELDGSSSIGLSAAKYLEEIQLAK